MSAHPLEPRSAQSRIDGLARAWRDAWAEPTPAAFAACCLLHVQYEDPLAHEPLEGTIALCDHVEQLRKGFPDLRIEPTGQAIGEGTYACVPWRAIGTQKGDLGTLPATNRFITLHGLHYLELEGGRVRRARGFFDLYDAALQLGLLPQRGSLTETALLVLRGFGIRPRA
ncbi:MAG: ester cyclase [Thermoleophilaceae bacterium]